MKKRLLSVLLVFALAVLPLCAGAQAERRVSARTPVYDADGARRENIRLAAKAINGAEVARNEQFSFNETVGARTRARGYRKAENGRGARVTGGGVGQAASTLYLALLKLGADVRYDALSTYGARYVGDYVSSGDLAILTDYSADTDFAFTNLTDDMKIEMWLDSDYLNCAVTIAEDDASGGWFAGWGDEEAEDAPEKVSVSIDVSECDAGTLENIRLAAASVNDTALAPGDLFSFNRLVGPRTENYGYRAGINGRGKKVTGGGVAQVASAVWLAVKDMDDIAIIEKSTYGSRYNQDYVESSADAIVTDYKEGTDFSFKYTGTGSIAVYTSVSGDALNCDILIYK